MTNKNVFTKEIQLEPEQLQGAVAGNSLFTRLRSGVKSVNRSVFSGFKESLVGKKEIDESILDEMEEFLLISDIGSHTARGVLEIIRSEFDKGSIRSREDMITLIKRIFIGIFNKHSPSIHWQQNTPTVMMMIGVNGSGKTTSIGKLSAQLQQEGKKVLVAACDTFRAAAVDQLNEWAGRAGVDIYAKSTGSDPSSTAFEASKKAVEENYDVLICDTSGRLHTKKNLMDELSKMKRVISKNIAEAPHYTLLTLDGTSGQNAARQAKEFQSVIGYDGFILTKLDGSAKGGTIIGIVNEFSLPVYYVGLGEKMGDLFPFDAEQYIQGIFAD